MSVRASGGPTQAQGAGRAFPRQEGKAGSQAPGVPAAWVMSGVMLGEYGKYQEM